MLVFVFPLTLRIQRRCDFLWSWQPVCPIPQNAIKLVMKKTTKGPTSRTCPEAKGMQSWKGEERMAHIVSSDRTNHFWYAVEL